MFRFYRTFEPTSMLFFFAFRSVSASFEASHDLKGIEVYRFALQQNTLDAPNVNPENRCFCKNQKTTRNCTLAGVLDISTCQDGQLALVWSNIIKARQKLLVPF